MKRFLFIILFITAIVLQGANQNVVGYSNSIPLHIEKQQPVAGFSQPIALHIEQKQPTSGNSTLVELHIDKNMSSVSATSLPVRIDIPKIIRHDLPDSKKPKQALSDVDINIPHTQINSPNTFALIIGNEDYQSHQTGLNPEVNVDFAVHDARIFKEYVTKTLGVPEKNILLLADAGLVEMKRAISKIKLLAKALQGNANIIVYYAGHGLPHEKTKKPYLIPVDISANDLEMAISLNDFYNDLTEHPSNKVIVFLDACFSGGAREQGLLSARGVKIKPKTDRTRGNLVVFSATSGSQSALPYRDKHHGLFTYYLLKALKSNKGKINLGELSEYLIKEVSVQSLLINSREQTPRVNKSPGLGDDWFRWMLF